MESWCCAMVKDGPGIIPVNVRLHLQYSACDLVLKKQERMKILGNGPCNGIIETEFKSICIGTKSGIMFHAHVESDAGEYKVNFLLSEKDLKTYGKKIKQYIKYCNLRGPIAYTRDFPAEINEFRDLKKTRLGKSLN